MTRQDSTALLREARAGSTRALDDLYARLAPRLHALIRIRMGRDLRARLESGDVLQATLLKSYERFAQFAGRDATSLMAWLSRIAENEIRDQADFQHRQRRDAKVSVPISGRHDLPDHVRSALSQAILNEEAERIERAIDALEPDHREVIVLRHYHELSFGEIARRMERSEDACRMLLARAMTRLTLLLNERS